MTILELLQGLGGRVHLLLVYIGSCQLEAHFQWPAGGGGHSNVKGGIMLIQKFT